MNIFKGLFKRASNKLEGDKREAAEKKDAAGSEPVITCARCGAAVKESAYISGAGVCFKCGHHHRISARTRLSLLADDGTFEEFDADMQAKDALDFPGYEKKLSDAKAKSGEKESVITGTCLIYGSRTAIFVMEPDFMMGSMGAATGEKITRLFEFATEKNLPVIGFTVSGGARMQEGMYSLMQMAKISAAIRRHSDKGLLYVVMLTDPTTGGVTASFAMLGDVILSEPEALIGFAGPRVIAQTMNQTLPEGFQSAEYLLKCGFIDDIVPRQTHKAYLKRLLSLHGYEEEEK